MSKLSALKAASSIVDVSFLLGIPASAIAFTLYKVPEANKYSTFEIPKKTGGVRTIAAPIERLKELQSALAYLLDDCRKEIQGDPPKKKLVSHGFRKEASIFTNAAQHRSRRYVLNLDIENFFPSINRGRVMGFFSKNKHFLLHKRVATVFAQIACFENGLPQGSPCSPIISDMISNVFDMRVIKLMKRHRCTYSRYADDITISTNQKIFPAEIAYQLEQGNSAWVPGDQLLDVVSRAGFSINHKKTRMQYRVSRQVVTGLTVNRKVNIRADYYRSARSMCRTLFNTGSFLRVLPHGLLPGTPGTLPQLEGILNHVHFARRWESERRVASDPIAIARRKKTEKQKEADKRSEIFPRYGADLLYERLLFYKKFVLLEKPLIVCEGKTDSVYLRSAIKRLPAFAGVLSETVAGKNVCKIQFFKYTRLAHELLELGGSSSYFPKLINRYDDMLKHYKYTPLKHPVILLIDNDDGAAEIFKALSKLHIAVDLNTTSDFYPITKNLYLVKTNEIGLGGYSRIEDYFDAVTLATPLNGKKFNGSKKLDPATEYGKKIFAENVIGPGAEKINFDNFTPLLDRIVSVISHHKVRVAAGPI